jgi:peptide chain release factor 3
MTQDLPAELNTEVDRRRNFAIISHPDAGKTTLTEKLLLYGGAIHQAGSVKARRAARHATSDWMEMEQQRGISITSTVLQFEYRDCQVNLLDTPGHQDFGEDTYRTLTAADNAVMLEDAAKGLEPQTRKLFEVCRMRSIPIFTFINKMDRPSREPLELLDEIEQELGLATYPVTWPIGSGDRFRGVFDRRKQKIHLFERTAHGSKEAADTTFDLGDPHVEQLIERELYYQLKDDLELLDELGREFNLAEVHAGQLTPVFFGSAMTNFGVQLLLDTFLEYALKPGSHHSNLGDIEPDYPDFTGFVFKLQANMDPKHRDRIAFVRVCSGKFEKDMLVNHARTGKTVRLSRPQKLFAQDRAVIETAYPGDVIGLNNPGVFSIGDTIYIGKKLEYDGIPCFSPELFSYLRNVNPSKFKQFRKGVDELREEGAVQIMYSVDEAKRDPILAAVGQLQFEVVQFRMQNEYGVETRLEPLSFSVARWVVGGWEALEKAGRLFNTVAVKDIWNRPVLLFRNEWNVNQLLEDHPELKLVTTAPAGSGETVLVES